MAFLVIMRAGEYQSLGPLDVETAVAPLAAKRGQVP